MDEKVERYLQDIRDLSKRYAEAKGQRVMLEHGRKAKLAALMQAAELQGHKTVAAQDREAHAHPDYRILLEGLSAAVHTELELEWELKIAEWRIEIWRTKEASARLERGRYAA